MIFYSCLFQISSLNPPGPSGKAKNLSFRTRNFREKIWGKKNLISRINPFWGDPPGRDGGPTGGKIEQKVRNVERSEREAEGQVRQSDSERARGREEGLFSTVFPFELALESS